MIFTLWCCGFRQSQRFDFAVWGLVIIATNASLVYAFCRSSESYDMLFQELNVRVALPKEAKFICIYLITTNFVVLINGPCVVIH